MTFDEFVKLRPGDIILTKERNLPVIEECRFSEERMVVSLPNIWTDMIWCWVPAKGKPFRWKLEYIDKVVHKGNSNCPKIRKTLTQINWSVWGMSGSESDIRI